MSTKIDEGSLKVDGFTIDEGLQKVLEAYRLQNAKSDTAVPEDHPILRRQNRITPHVKGLEGIVKNHLGKSPRFNPEMDYEKADAIINELAYALAKTEGYKGELKDFKDEDVRRYLGNVATATGNPIFSNKTALIDSILNLAFANPDSEQYAKDSPLAVLTGYIGALQDDPDKESKDLSSAKLNYTKQVLAEKWSRLGKDGRAIPNVFNAKTGINLKPYATANEAFAEVERQGTYELQGIISKLPKTYQATSQTQMDKAA